MKTLFASFLFLLFFARFCAQDSYTLRIIDTQNKPLANVLVKAENQTTKKVHSVLTDPSGKAVFSLVDIGVYSFSYLDQSNVATAEVKEGFTAKFARTLTYDPKGTFAVKPKKDRSGIAFSEMTASQLRGQKNVIKLNVILKQPEDRAVVPSVPLVLVSFVEKVKYMGTTNSMGQVTFHVPCNQTYELDVAGMDGFKQIAVPNELGVEMSDVVFYAKTKVNEKAKGDTILQNAIKQTNGTSTHILFVLNLLDYSGKPLSNESVYMDAVAGKRVYQGKTDENGKCFFMLEKGTDYIANLKYERGICKQDAPLSSGFQSASATRRYRGSAEVERMMAEQAEQARLWKAEQDRLDKLPKPGDAGFPISFRSTPVNALTKPANYLNKTTEGFTVDFGSAGEVGTPTVVGDKLFTQEGLYSPNYYCLNAQSGAFVWGTALGESGLSPAVYHDGVLLINTASCTLYALDAKTGALLWSKWLAGYVYSTPSASGNDVVVGYSHGGTPVIASFDLRSGDLKWLQRVDDEVIASPVLADNEVHVASQSGSYYVFDKETGKSLGKSNTLKVVSSPTIVNAGILITVNKSTEERLVLLVRSTLEIKKTYASPMKAIQMNMQRNTDRTDPMAYNGSHAVVYKNKFIFITDNSYLYAYDLQGETFMWRQEIATSPELVPVVANDKVVLASSTGDLFSFDCTTGTKTLIRKGKGTKLEGQPVFANGLVYVVSAGVLSVVKSVQQLPWPQWNQSAAHNLVVD